jgi:hypothetical protein
MTAESQCSWQLQLITRAKGPGANSTDALIEFTNAALTAA